MEKKKKRKHTKKIYLFLLAFCGDMAKDGAMNLLSPFLSGNPIVDGIFYILVALELVSGIVYCYSIVLEIISIKEKRFAEQKQKARGTKPKYTKK